MSKTKLEVIMESKSNSTSKIKYESNKSKREAYEEFLYHISLNFILVQFILITTFSLFS